MCLVLCACTSGTGSGTNAGSKAPRQFHGTGNQTTLPPRPTATPIPTATPVPTEEPKPEDLTKYPAADIFTKYYGGASEFPKNAYHTPASENGMAGKMIFIQGTVTGVYSTQAEFFEARNIEAEAKQEYEGEYFVLRTKIGEVSFFNISSGLIQKAEKDYGTDSDEYADVIKVHKDYSAKNDLPSVGETCILYGCYIGYSDTIDLPVIYYGISDGIYELTHKTEPVVEPDTEIGKGFVPYNFGALYMAVPEKWKTESLTDQYIIFKSGSSYLQIGKVLGVDASSDTWEASDKAYNEIGKSSDITFYDVKKSDKMVLHGKKTAHTYSAAANMGGADVNTEFTMFRVQSTMYWILLAQADNNTTFFNQYEKTLKSLSLDKVTKEAIQNGTAFK